MKKKVFRERYAEHEDEEVLVKVSDELIGESKEEVRKETKKRGRKKSDKSDK